MIFQFTEEVVCAQTQTWTLQNFTFSPSGATLTGNFTWDATTTQVTSWNVTVANAPSPFFNVTYTPANSTSFSGLLPDSSLNWVLCTPLVCGVGESELINIFTSLPAAGGTGTTFPGPCGSYMEYESGAFNELCIAFGQVTTLPLSCTTTAGPTQVGIPYSATCTVSGGTAPYTWSFMYNTPPPTGLSLVANGDTATISGTPTIPGGYDYILQVADSSVPQQTDWQEYSGTIVGTACTATADAVFMQDSHTLNVDISATFSSNTLTTKVLGLKTTIGGVQIAPHFVLPSGTAGQQSFPFPIDLTAYSVPRFTDNARFSITAEMSEGGQACASTPADAVVLLPTIVVPGIDPLAFIPGTNPYRLDPLIKYFQNNSNVIPTLLGQAYRWAGSQPPYPTLYELFYNRNTSTFSEGAAALASLVAQVRASTYADRVNIVGHSKGGLIARAYAAGNGTQISRLLMCQTPNVGSLDASLFALPLYNDLEAIWNWYRKDTNHPFMNPDSNTELQALNQQLLPGGVTYYILYSQSFSSVLTATGIAGHISLAYTNGDDTVPWFSALGRLVDPNIPNDPGILIPAFDQPITITELPNEHHAGFLNDQAADCALVQLLANPVNGCSGN